MAPAAQKILVGGDLSGPGASPRLPQQQQQQQQHAPGAQDLFLPQQQYPLPSRHAALHYESPFRMVDMKAISSLGRFCHDYYHHHHHHHHNHAAVLVVVACALGLTLSGLCLIICGAMARRRRQGRPRGDDLVSGPGGGDDKEGPGLWIVRWEGPGLELEIKEGSGGEGERPPREECPRGGRTAWVDQFHCHLRI